MINPADLDTRLMSHAAHVDAVNRYGSLVPPKHRSHNESGSFVRQLRRLSARLAHGHIRQPRGGSAAA